MSNGAEAPWSGDAEQLIRGALRHVFDVKIYPDTYTDPVYLPVTVTAVTLTLDEFWSPYVQGELVAQIPDAATLAKLDPRLLVRVDVSAGYVLPGGIRDVHPVAVCFLSGRSVDYPANELRLAFQGPEWALDRYVAGVDAASPANWTSTTRAGNAIYSCLSFAGFEILSTSAYRFDEDVDRALGWVDPGQPWVGQAGDNPLSLAREIADRVDGWFRCDRDGLWRFSQRRWSAGEAAHRLRAGADGTIISSSDTAGRDEWANRSYVHYQWSTLTTTGGVSTAVQRSASGAASLAGPYAPNTVGTVTVRAERAMPSTTTQATEAAKALLRRYSVRADSLQISAVAAYWLRPPNTVTVELPGAQLREVCISAITFDLVTGRMDLRTRNPVAPDVIAL